VEFAKLSNPVSSHSLSVFHLIADGELGLNTVWKNETHPSGISFGDGVYSYRNPALADNFATSCTSSPYRVMIACDVAVEPAQTRIDEVRRLSMYFGLWPILNASPVHRGRIALCPNGRRHPASVHFHVQKVRERWKGSKKKIDSRRRS
jgi:hypothetical protein